MSKSKEVAKKDVAQVPAFMDQTDYDGYENVDQDSLAIPFLKIAQNTTSQAMSGDPSEIEGLKPGMLFNTVSQQVYGTELRVILLGYYRMFVEWEGEESNGRFVRSVTPEEFDRMRAELIADGSSWTTPNSTRIVDTRNFFVLLPDHLDDGIVLFPMQSTGITHAKKILTKARMTSLDNGKRAPLYAKVWRFETRLNANDFGRWYQIGQRGSTAIYDEGWAWEVSDEVNNALKMAVGEIKTLLERKTDINMAGAAEGGTEEEDEL